MKKYTKPYLLLFISLFVLSFVIQGILLRSWNSTHLAGIQGDMFKPFPMVLNYLILAAGLLYFLIKTKAIASPKQSALTGGIFSALLFINFGLTNLSLLPYYPIAMIISDTVASVITFSIAAYLTSRFN